MAGLARISGVVLDCPDARALGDFYSKLTGIDLAPDSDDDWVQLLLGPAGPVLAFQRVDDYRAPEWPGQDHPQQFHLDFDVEDLDEGEAAVLAIGATKHDHQPGRTFRVFLDPAGHPFCLCLA